MCTNRALYIYIMTTHDHMILYHMIIRIIFVWRYEVHNHFIYMSLIQRHGG